MDFSRTLKDLFLCQKSLSLVRRAYELGPSDVSSVLPDSVGIAANTNVLTAWGPLAGACLVELLIKYAVFPDDVKPRLTANMMKVGQIA